ncbi:uncharacterized protein TNCV_4396691 [Trichonephila clavipes]|uniref:RNase H type-1 domain-containing protein n=1 Tax=Trichonephila clavipes TaxID=2585209 RepID=A0A8X7BFC1_TRICX|nr:uncharacterized protein TNCV_4396691 [Trichonephila clavipes]
MEDSDRLCTPLNVFDTGLDILSKLVRLGPRKQVCFQWIPSHVGVSGYEAAGAGWAHQTALASVRSGHLRNMTLVQGIKSFFTCPCSLLASPAHLLDCWGISLRQLYEEQDLVCIEEDLNHLKSIDSKIFESFCGLYGAYSKELL